MAYTRNPRPLNKCQYWIEKEPIQCTYWDNTNTICTFEEEVTSFIAGVETTFIQRGDKYPFCNYIGTARFTCTKYAVSKDEEPVPTEDTEVRCVLPDPYRHVSMSPHCSKWVTPPATLTTASGEPIPLDYTRINGYNEGKCNFDGSDKTGGTDVTCSGFSPHHLGFGTAPIQDVCTISGVTTSGTTTASGFPSGSHIPMKYDVLNKRALLGRCKWWKSDKYDFTLKEDTAGKLSIEAPEFKCENTAPEVQKYADFYKDVTNTDMRPPCNGAMPDCTKYSGNLASTGFMPYLSSVYLRGGDKIMAEQILEIRYNLKKETWDKEEYANYFGQEAIIFANEGSSPEIIYEGANNIVDYKLLAIKTEISDFTCFAISRTQVTLTKGTSSDSLTPTFPTLIKELKDILYEPIIRSVFDRHDEVYVFETPYSDHEKILIVGEYFGYNSNLFAINVSDPTFDFPFNDILRFNNMYSFRAFALGVGEDLEYAEQRFKDRHAQLACYFKLLKEVASDKIYLNEWSATSGSFGISVKTIFGKNKILVFDTSTDIYTFSTININKVFCGGIIAQTSFEVTKSEEEVSNIVDYEQEICFPRYSPKINYKFEAFKNRDNSIGASAVHTYIDTKVVVPPNGTLIADENTTYFLGYRMYKIKVMDRFYIDNTCESADASKLLFLGNEGYVLVVIADDCKLHGVIRKWDSGEVDESGNAKALQLFLVGKNALEEDVSIEMEVLEYCSSRLEINQLLLKPKNADDYVRLYNPVIEFKEGLYVYERWSFDKTPSGTAEEIRDGWPEEDTTLIFSVATLDNDDLAAGDYTITNLPTSPMTATVIFSGGLTNRIKGQAKTDLVIWAKKPYCSDVEIMYSWQANYQEVELLPTAYCFVRDIGTRKIDTGIGGSSPRCGDHSFGSISRRPSLMWYPYTACDEYATYALKSGNYENDEALMEFWLNDVGKPDFDTEHGSEDLRMLGPAQHYGFTTDTHSTVWACGCDYTYHNNDMISTPWFAGFARIRAGVTGEAFYYMTQNGGIGPKFGNKTRPYLLSYRSVAAIHFYVVNDYGGVSIDKKWLPMYEAFSDMYLNAGFTEYPWKNYFNESDNVTTYISQFGLMAARSTVDNISIGEHLVKDSDTEVDSSLKRYRFDEVFIAHSTSTGMVYPAPRKVYYKGTDNPMPITAWLTYKDSPEGPDTAIMWAWRERWKPLERELLDIRTVLMDMDLAICDTSTIHSKYLRFLDIFYTNYTYDFRIDEFRRIPSEGFHKLIWEPSKYNEEKPLPTYFVVRLGNSGPVRVLNTKLELITDPDVLEEGLTFESITLEDIKKHLKFYKICSEAPWLNSITSETDLETMSQISAIEAISGGFILYHEETAIADTEEIAKKNAEDGKRVVTIYKDGEEYDIYFNRGLYCTINSSLTKYIPKDFKAVELPYEFKLSKPSEDDTDYAVLDPNLFYPAMESFGIKYFFLTQSVTITFKFEKPINIGKIDIVYAKGKEDIEPENEGELKITNYFHIPEVVFKRSTDGVEFKDVETFDFESSTIDETRAVTTKNYKLSVIDQEYMSELSSSFSVTFNFSTDSINFENNDTQFFHYIFIDSIKFSEVFYVTQEEVIQLHERKFNISVGAYGTFPIHGKEGEGSLLYPSTSELSTTYQYDNAWGMVGMSNSDGEFTSAGKTQNRICKAIQEDGESLNGSYLDFEMKQKELYDEVALSGGEEIVFTSLSSDVFKEVLKDTGVTSFPEWQCSLKNNTIVPLRAVQEKQLYYPEGHNWTWDNKSFKDFFNCGGGGLRQYVTIFAYKWGRISGIYGFVHERDIFDLYSYGLSDALTRLANPDMALAERLNSL